MRRFFRMLLPVCLLVLAPLLAGCGQEAEQPREFTIALSGYLMGQLGPCSCPGNPLGGVHRRAGVLKQELAGRDGALILDAGKWVSMDVNEMEASSEAVLAALSTMGVQAVHVAQRDSRLGKSELLRLQDIYDLPFVSANLVDAESGEPLFDAYREIPVRFEDGATLTAGVIGVSRANSSSYMHPESGLAYADPDSLLIAAYREVMDRPVVILLTDADRNMTADWLGTLEKATGDRPDFVFSSNLHPTRNTRVMIGQTPMATAGRQGKYVDLLRAIPEENGEWDMRTDTFPLDDDAPVDADVVEVVERIAGAGALGR